MDLPAPIGKALAPLDGPAKAAGRLLFADDLALPGLLHGALVRSPIPHGRIRELDPGAARGQKGVRDLVTGRDLPGPGTEAPGLEQPPLARDLVRFLGQEVAAVCARDLATARRAARLVQVAYEPLPAAASAAEALAEEAPRLHTGVPGNLGPLERSEYGDLAEGFAAAAYVREDQFRLAAAEPTDLEPRACLALPGEGGGVTVYVNAGAPQLVRNWLARTLDLPPGRVRVVVAGEVPGDELPPGAAEFCAALFALRTGRPVKFVLERAEALAAGPRHPALAIRSKTAFAADGVLLARDWEVLVEGGAYVTPGPSALRLCGLLGSLPYRLGAVRYLGRQVFTNTPPALSSPGFLARQVAFALETQLNLAAEALGRDPLELRLKNAVRAGDLVPGLGRIASCGLEECLRKVHDLADWERKRREAAPGRGIGVACYGLPVGGSLAGEGPAGALAAAEVRLFADGGARLAIPLAGAGREAGTLLRQVMAADLGMAPEDIRLAEQDSAQLPPLGEDAAPGRGLLASGRAVLRATGKLKALLAPVVLGALDPGQRDQVAFAGGRVFARQRPAEGLSLAECARRALQARGDAPLFACGQYPVPPEPAAPAFVFGAQVVEASVDLATGLIRVARVASAHDGGVVINPLLRDGLREGALALGLGYALAESTAGGGGVPRSPDLPETVEATVATPEPAGPFGAKTAEEGLALPTAPALAAAVQRATGLVCQELPLTPERVLRGLGRLR